MMKQLLRPVPSLMSGAVLLTLAAISVQAEDLAEKARAVFKQNQHVVVTVELVIKTKFSMSGMPGQAREVPQDATGTVIDPSGLTVLSLSTTDPAQLMQSMMAGADEEGESRFKVESELSDLKILLDDGTELPAEVVLRDKDLDLAFIRPKSKPATPMAALDLTQAGKAEVLDEVVALNRLGNAAGRAYAAAMERISAIVQKPRLFYIPETSMTTTALGAPAFTMDGKPLGIFVVRSIKSRGGGMGMFSMQAENVTGIIIPVADIAKAAKQVPAADSSSSSEPAKASDEKKSGEKEK